MQKVGNSCLQPGSDEGQVVCCSVRPCGHTAALDLAWPPCAETSGFPQVLGLTSNVRKMFKDMDEALYEECRLNYEAEEASSLKLHMLCPATHVQRLMSDRSAAI